MFYRKGAAPNLRTGYRQCCFLLGRRISTRRAGASAALKLIATIALRSLAIARSPPPRYAIPQTSSRGEKLGDGLMSWLGKLEKARAEIASPNIDSWRLPLERLHGK